MSMGCKGLFYCGWRRFVVESISSVHSITELFPLPWHVAMPNFHAMSGFQQALPDFLRDHDGAVLAAGAAETDGEITFAFANVVGQQINEEVGDAPDKFLALRKRSNVLRHSRIFTGERTKCGHKVRVGQKANVEDKIGILGQAVPKAEADTGNQNAFL